jgi:hypothetical protein
VTSPLPRRIPGAALAAAQAATAQATTRAGAPVRLPLACGDTVTLPAPVCFQPDLLGLGEGTPAYGCPEHGYQPARPTRPPGPASGPASGPEGGA